MKFSNRITSFALATTGWLVILLLWALPTETGMVDPLFLASPSQTIRAAIAGIVSGDLLAALAATLGRAVSGFVIATILGVPLGLLLGGIASVRRVLGGVVDGLRSMPATALFPAFLLVFGIGDTAKVAVATFVCMWAMTIYTAAGVQGSGETRRFLLRLHRVTPLQYFVDGLLYPALPNILGGMRTSVSLALVVTIATEMIVGTKVGLGQAIYSAQITFRAPAMYAAIMLAALGGMALNAGFLLITRRLVHWD